jgi:hypothetical protein
MTKTILLAGAAALCFATGAQAQDAPQTPPSQQEQAAQAPAPTGPTTEAPLVDRAQQGVLVFQPEFFAEQRPNTALDMVERVPGFSVDDGDGGRGFEGAVGNILINGARPASKNDTGSSVLSRTLAGRVQRVELIRGGAPGIDMQGYSVVVNVLLKDEASRQSVLTLNGYLFEGGQDQANGSYQFTATDGDRSWGFTLSDGVSISDANGVGPSIRVDADGNELRRETFFNDSRGGGQAIRGNYADAFMGGKIDLTARYGLNDYSEITLLTAPGVERDSRFEEDGASGEVGVVYTRDLSSRLSSETRFIHEFGDFENASISNNLEGGVTAPEQLFAAEGESSETILRSLLKFEPRDKLNFEFGGEVAYNMLEVDQAYSVGGVNVPLPSASVKVEETRGELFGKGTWRVRPDLTLEGGLRFEASTISQSGDADQEETFTFAKPRFLATWTPMEKTQFRFRFEREVGQLDFGDFAASSDLDDEQVFGGNADLAPESRWISEVAAERRFLDDGIVSVTYRHDEISDVIDVIPLEDGLSAVGNIGDGILDQLAVNVLVPMDWAGFTGGQLGFRNEWNHTEVTDPTTGETRPISNVRRSQAVFTIQQDITSWKLQWGGAYIPLLGQTGYDPDQRSGWRGHDYFEGWAEYKPTSTLTLRAQVNVWNDFFVFRDVYADRASPRPIAFIETRAIDPRTFWSLRLRKTF